MQEFATILLLPEFELRHLCLKVYTWSSTNLAYSLITGCDLLLSLKGILQYT